VIQHSGLPRFAVTAANRSARCGVALTGALAQSTALVVAGRGFFFAVSPCPAGVATGKAGERMAPVVKGDEHGSAPAAGEAVGAFICAMGGHGDPQTGRTSLGPSAAVCSAAPRSFARTDCGAEIKVAGSTPASRSRSAIRNTAVTGKTGQRQTGRSAILRVNADVTGGERPAPYSGSPVVEPTP
jgi:hypothetical protein